MRTAITILAIVVGLAFAAAVFFSSQPPREAPPTAVEQEDARQAAEAPREEAPAPAARDASDQAMSAEVDAPPAAQEADSAAPATAASPPLEGLHVVQTDDPAAPRPWQYLGSADPDSPYKLRARLNDWGAAVAQITLSDYRQAVTSDDRYVVLEPIKAGRYTLYPYAARAVSVDGQTIDLQRAAWTPVEATQTQARAAVEYQLFIADASEQPVLELRRRYELVPGTYDITLRQRAINRSGQPLTVVWQQNIQGDMPYDKKSYLGDVRQFVTGYFNLEYDPRRVQVHTADAFIQRGGLIDRGDIWPNPDLAAQVELAWIAAENRYFTVVTHPVVTDEMNRTADVPPLEERFPQVRLSVLADATPGREVRDADRGLVFTLTSEAVPVAPGAAANFDLAIYAGPREGDLFKQEPYALLHFGEMIRYELGCTWFTFQPLARGLLWFLELIEGEIISIGGVGIGVHDWGVAIIILVLIVRLILHPITKKAQVNMMKMGKQMQTLQPELEKLKKKYKDDQPKLNQEMMKLYREKGVNPANALGCLPMFLQTPIWIALYAMLFYAIELRHEPAFYGVFQWMGSLFGVYWPFLADLSSADHFIKFPGEGFTLNLIFVHPTFSGLNILPILMAAVFFVQQKFTMPPPANEQAAQQQKMMRFMVLLFPVFLYSAPSGLTLYILASTAAGVVDSYIVRKHVREQEEAGTLFVKKERKPGGLMDRLAKQLEQKQRQLAEQQQKQAGKGKAKGRGH